MIRQGQAPQICSLLVGSGRLARHFQFYFDHLNLPYRQWCRRDGDELRGQLSGITHVLLAVSDASLPLLIERDLANFQGPIVHFSGAFQHPNAIGAHPLMTFGPELYPPEFYPHIHFTVSGGNLDEALPGLKNPWSMLLSAERARYHALCVLGGNFPVLLWHKMESDLARLGVPPAATHLYISKVAENYLRLGERALTGPLVRKDTETIRKNIAALEGDAWQVVYQSFLEAVQ